MVIIKYFEWLFFII